MANPIIREKPLQVEKTIVSIGSAGILLRPFQLVVWATLQPRGQYDLQPDAVWLPCVVDTGFNGTFCIAQEHLGLVPYHERFLYLGLQQLAHRGGIETARRVEADLWIRSEVEGCGAVKVELPSGALRLSPTVARHDAQRTAPRTSGATQRPSASRSRLPDAAFLSP